MTPEGRQEHDEAMFRKGFEFAQTTDPKPVYKGDIREKIVVILCEDCRVHLANHQCEPKGNDANDCYGYLADQITPLLNAKVEYWREKCFNDTMSAKKSGWDDCEKWHKGEVEEANKQERERREMQYIVFRRDGICRMKPQKISVHHTKIMAILSMFWHHSLWMPCHIKKIP